MASGAWRARVAALAAAGGFLLVGLGIRELAGSSSALSQFSGTALYAAMIYAGVFVVAPRAEPRIAGTAAIAFCWFVELLQLTGLPAALSERSLVARLVLGVQFDATDLAWYVVGVVPLALLHFALARHRN